MCLHSGFMECINECLHMFVSYMLRPFYFQIHYICERFANVNVLYGCLPGRFGFMLPVLFVNCLGVLFLRHVLSALFCVR